MNKKLLFLIIIAFVTLLVFLFYRTSVQHTCTYPSWVKENNNIVVQNLSEFQNGAEPGCRIPVTVCSGNACSDPMMWLECNKKTDVCGEKISCECK